MNKHPKNNSESLRSLLLMAELEEGRPISQREIAARLGIALGLVNTYLKALVKKGYVQVKAYPRNRFAYLLTPKGFAEKSHLAYRHLSNFNKLYRITRLDSLALFDSLRQQGAVRVSFCGVDDLMEIAYLSLREAGLELASVMDDEGVGGSFLGAPVVSLPVGVEAGDIPILITSPPRVGHFRSILLQLGVAEQNIHAPSFRYDEVFR